MLGLKPAKQSKSSLTPNQLTFDSEFECGNIDSVRMRSPVEYDLFMRNDSNGNSNL